MNIQLQNAIQTAQNTQATFLDLGNMGLDGSEPELNALADCPSLQSLSFATEWWRSESNQARIEYKTKNKAQPNKLESLDFAFPPNLKQLFLAKATFLGNKKKRNKQKISTLYTLEELDLFGCELADTAVLSTLTNLQNLTLTDNPLRGLEGLAPLSKLEIFVANAANVKKIDVLANLRQLKNLLFWSNGIWDISPVAELVHLEELTLGCNRIKDIQPLANLHQLQSIQLWANDVEDISVLAELTELRNLNLSDNRKINSINHLHKLRKLESLHIDRTEITDISVLDGLKNLWHLSIDSNKIEHLPSYPILRIAINYHTLRPFDAKTNPRSGDYAHIPEPKDFDKVWKILIGKGRENIALAEQLASGLGWDAEVFQTYSEAAQRFASLRQW